MSIDVPNVIQHEKLSSLLAAALSDARHICKRSNIKLDMSHWLCLNNSDAVCYVCLAGAMLVDSVPRGTVESLHKLRLPNDHHLYDPCLFAADFAQKTTKYLRAIDSCRVGDVGQAMFEFAIGYQVPTNIDTDAIRRLSRDVKRRVCESMQIGDNHWPAFDREPDLWWQTMDELVKQLEAAGQ